MSPLARGLSLALLALSACLPGRFDELGHANTSGDAGAGMDGALDQDGSPLEEQDGAFADAEPNDAEPVDANDLPPDEPDASCPLAPDGGRKLVVRGQPKELARLRNPEGVSSRVLNATAWLGSNRIWTFSGTVPSPAVLPPDAGAPMPFASAAIDGPLHPWDELAPTTATWKLEDALDSGGGPVPFLTLSAEDAANGISYTVPSVIRRSSSENAGLAYVRKVYGFFGPQQVWLADIAERAKIGTLRAEPLFANGEPLFSQGAHRGSEYVKVFACKRVPGATDNDPPTFPCLLARVPLVLAGDRRFYEVRTAGPYGEGGWSTDFSKAVPVLNAIDDDLSISWNAHLGQFLAVHSAFFSNRVLLHTAPAIEGPWTDAGEVTLPQPKVWIATHAREQPGLVQSCGKRIIITHWAATVAEPVNNLPIAGDVVMSAIDLE